jgi:sugar/nucleoside kinase (ribokinase family)
VAVTLGKDGCPILDGTDLVVERGFEVDVVDSTSAGDSFNAALVAGYLWGWDKCSLCLLLTWPFWLLPKKTAISTFVSNIPVLGLAA